MANSQFNFEYFNEYQTYLSSLGEDNSKTKGILMKNLSRAIREELTEKQWRAVQMYYVDEMKMADIASYLNVNISTVSRTVKRGREKLRKCLKYGAKELLNDCISASSKNGACHR